MIKEIILIFIAVFLQCFISTLSLAATKEEVRERDYVLCGVSTGIPGFSTSDEQGNWRGFDVEFCRAVAAATLGDANKVKFIPLSSTERFTALMSGEVDLLSRGTAWTFTRDTSLGFHFTGTSYFDGQGVMAAKESGITSSLELDGVAICVQSGTIADLNLQEYFVKNSMEYKPVLFTTADQMAKGFETGRCTVLAGNFSLLHGLQSRLAKSQEVVLLPEVISRQPLGPVVRQGDDAWFNIVRWTLYAMINGEVLGVTSVNVEAMKGSAKPEVRRLLGLEGIKGDGLGLESGWAFNILKQVGNYGELFDRNVGIGSELTINRGLNNLWTNGGLLFAPPFR